MFMDSSLINISELEFRNICSQLNLKKEIDSYLFIQKSFEDRIFNEEFIKVYKWFYKLDNAGLGEKIKNKNFELIESKETDLEKILSDMYDIPTLRGYHSIQLSFASKIIHTIDNGKSIYDRNVSKLLSLSKVLPSNKSKKQRIDSALCVYEDLTNKSNQIIKSNAGKNLISYFYRLDVLNVQNVPETKVLDFCFWILGSLLK